MMLRVLEQGCIQRVVAGLGLKWGWASVGRELYWEKCSYQGLKNVSVCFRGLRFLWVWKYFFLEVKTQVSVVLSGSKWIRSLKLPEPPLTEPSHWNMSLNPLSEHGHWTLLTHWTTVTKSYELVIEPLVTEPGRWTCHELRLLNPLDLIPWTWWFINYPWTPVFEP